VGQPVPEALALSHGDGDGGDIYEALALSHGDGDGGDIYEALALSHGDGDGGDIYEALALSTGRDSLRSSLPSVAAVLASSGPGRDRSPFESARGLNVSRARWPCPSPGRAGLALLGHALPARERLVGQPVPGTGSARALHGGGRDRRERAGATTALARGGLGPLALRWNHHARTLGTTSHRAGLKGAARSTR
jgi:hypothetical protein